MVLQIQSETEGKHHIIGWDKSYLKMQRNPEPFWLFHHSDIVVTINILRAFLVTVLVTMSDML